MRYTSVLNQRNTALHGFGARVLAATLFVTGLTGCAVDNAIRRVDGPARPLILTHTSDDLATRVKNARSEYETRLRTDDLEGAKASRNLIVYDIRREIEVVYREFEQNLFSNKAAFEIETDIFELLVSSIATVTTGARAKTNLAALLTGTKGARLSVDKNVFAEKTYGALVAQMRAARGEISATITQKLASLDVRSYPLAEAELDLVRLFNAGTLHEALVQLAADAGKNEKAAVEKEAKVEQDRIKLQVATQKEAGQAAAIRAKFNQLKNDKNISDAKAALQKLDPSTPGDIPDDDVWKKLNEEIKKGADKKYLPKLLDAFGVE